MGDHLATRDMGRKDLSAHVYCGQTVAHLSYCRALVLMAESPYTLQHALKNLKRV